MRLIRSRANNKSIKMSEQSNQKIEGSTVDVSESRLLAEYRECFTNYIHRDQFVAHEFYLAATIVGIVITIMNYLGNGIGQRELQ
jgi:hypothetical protein